MSTLQAGKTYKMTLINKLLEQRYDELTRVAKCELRQFYDSNSQYFPDLDFIKAYADADPDPDLDPEFWKNYNENELNKQMDLKSGFHSHRRVFFTYYRKIMDLIDSGLLERVDLQALINDTTDLNMFLSISWPIEIAHRKTLLHVDVTPPNTNEPIDPKPFKEKEDRIFDYFYNYYWERKDKKELKKR